MEIAGDRNPRPLAFEPVQKKRWFSKKHEKSSESSDTTAFVEVYVQDVKAERKRDLGVFMTSNHSPRLSLEVYKYLGKETLPCDKCMLNRANVEIMIGSRLKESGPDSAAHSHQIMKISSPPRLLEENDLDSVNSVEIIVEGVSLNVDVVVTETEVEMVLKVWLCFGKNIGRSNLSLGPRADIDAKIVTMNNPSCRVIGFYGNPIQEFRDQSWDPKS
ncbi:hypothetical protein M0R45_005728 [Rubus argutus]|uniref:Uncharacterized protein n=1 Tax=Rubus argutus TaxID=59490 RepID=A0AAW1YNX4_RUBAR